MIGTLKMNKINFEKFPAFFNNKRILITGNTGFKGGWLSHILLGFGAKVTGYALNPNENQNLFTALNLDNKMKTYFSDVRNYEKLKTTIDEINPEIIFHLAAQPLVRLSYEDPLLTYTTNVIGTANLLQAIKENKHVAAVVMITTDKVYENKEWSRPYNENDELGGYDPYSSSKTCAEFVISSYTKSFFNSESYGKSHNTLIAVARAGNVIGGGDWSVDRLIPDIIRAFLEQKKQVTIRNLASIRPWQHVLEPLFGYMLLAKKLYEKDTSIIGPWNFAPEEENSVCVKKIVESAIKIMGSGDYNSTSNGDNKHEAKLLKLDSTKAKKKLGWYPKLNIEECLDLTFKWYKTYYTDKKNIIKITNQQIERYIK